MNNMAGQLNIGMAGFMRLQCINPETGKCRVDTGFFPNKILTSGLNAMNTQASWLTHCHVGTDNTAPIAGHTQLLGFVVATSTVTSNLTGTQGSAPYFGWRRKTFRFAAGAGHGGEILSEAGIGWGASGSTLISRALIVDPLSQLPTSVTPLVDEILDVTYELRYYPPLVDVANSVTLNGVVYDTLTRAADVTDALWSDRIGERIGEYSPGVSSFRAYTGALGSIDLSPSGTSHNCDNSSQYNETYSNNSYQVVMVSDCGPTGWNAPGGIRCLYATTTAGAFQTEFTSNPGGLAVPKTTDFTMRINWTLGWSEFV